MHLLNRRQLLHAAGAGVATLSLAPLTALARAQPAGFTLPKLPYDTAALEPYIDAETMQIHHDLHHQAYITNLNNALKSHPDLLKKDITTLMREINLVPEGIRQAVINNGGGHANHTLFWEVMTPNKSDQQVPSALAKALDAAFGSQDKLKEMMSQAAVTRFGSGWAWLVAGDKGKLEVFSTANQDSPLLKGQTPLLGLDVWEHAYYLKYKNRRPEYVKAWWNVVNWKNVAERHAAASKG
jgi:Fe-Mn family superoxide dismutase